MALFFSRNEFKVVRLPEKPVPNAIYFVLKAGYVEEWVTDVKGVAYQVKSDGGAGSDPGTGGGGDFTVTLETSETVVAGQPLRVNSGSKFELASAASFNTARTAGLATANTAAGFAATADRTQITLSDWTAVAGSQLLTPGATYFLGVVPGTITSIPPNSVGQCVCVLGEAVSTTTLAIEMSDPIQL
jgi:hypothetical protein